MQSSVIQFGVDILGPAWGTHFCVFYQTKGDLLDILIPFFKAGLENNEYCMWVTSEPLNEKDAEKAMRASIPNFDKYLHKNQIEIIPYTEWYVENNEFDSQRVLNGWGDKCKYALDNGFEGLRLTGNTFWLEDKDWKDFADYEEQVNEVISSYNMIAICTYSLEKCGSFEILDVVRNHQYALFRREGSWEIFKGSEQTKIEQKLKEAELRYRTTFEQSPDGIIILDLETTKAIEFNNAICDILGYSRAEFAELNISDYDAVEDPSDTRAHTEKVLLRGKDDFVTKMRTKNGDIKDIHVIAKVIELTGKKYFQSIWRDITESKKTERKLKESEEKWRALSENSPAHVLLLDREHKIIFINRTVPDLSKEEVIGTSIFNYTPQEFHKVTRDCYYSVWETGEPSSITTKYITKEGDISYFDVWVGPVFQSGKVVALVNHSMDITERKKKEEKIRLQSEIIENMLEGVNLIKLDDGTIVLTNPAFDEMFGYNPGEMIGKNVAIINAPTEKTPEETREEIMGILKDAGEWHGEMLNVKKDGTPFWCYSNVSLFDHPEYETVCVSVYTDITERKKIEQELKESEEEFRMLFNAANDAIFIVDLECNIIECNKTSNERLGYTRDELLNMTPMDLDTPEYAESVLDRIEIVRQKGESFYEVEHLRKDGKILPVEINSKLINFQGKTAILSIVRDITERKKIEQELKEYEYKLSERVKELTCLYGLSKLVENPVISLRDIINGTLSLIPPALQFPDISTARIIYDSREYKLENFEETAWKLSTRVKINEKPVLIEAYYLEDKLFLKEEHDLIRDIGVRLKTTLEEKEAQNKLRISEEKYRMGFESSTDGIASADMEGTFLDFNNAFLEMLGYSREELLKLNFREITPRRWHEMEDNMIISQLADGKDSGIYEKEYIRKDSTFFPVEVRFWIIKDEQGDPVRMWEIVRDITERKKAEEEITNLAKFPSESPYPVLRVNRNRVIYINDSGKHLLNLKDNDEIPKFLQKEINEAFESNSITESEVEVKNRFYSFTTTPPLEKGYVNIYGMDITEKKQVEQKLKEINKLKSEFLRRASHELKTPLISIKGFSDLILALHKDQINPDVISKLNEINRGCERLQNIINNLLATSRLESPDIKPKVQREDLTFLIKYCVHELQSLAQTRNQIINLDIFDGQYALFEKEEIHDVISNLLTNAIKYTPPNGRIDLRTEIKNGLIIISIKDDGIGFTEDEKSKIFKQFGKIERYGQGLDLGIDGTGLGLYISKRIVESHGGTIWMDSEGKNKGSTFCFSLPLK